MASNRFVSFFQTRKDKINFWFPIIISILFLFSFLPNLTRIPYLSSFLINYAVAWRSVGAIITFIYFVFAFIANGFKFNRLIFWVAIGLIFFTFVALFANINPLTEYLSYKNQYAKIVVIEKTYGAFDILTFLFNNLWCALFFFYLFGVYPLIEKSNKLKYLPYMILIILVSLNIIICVVTEYKTIINILKGNFSYSSGEGIHALFPSKNAFGMFLFQGFALSIYMIFRSNKKWLLAFIIVFAIFILLSLCKSAYAGFLVLLLALAVGSLINFKKHLKINIAISIILGLLLLAFILFVSIPALHSSGIGKKIYDFLFGGKSDSRTGIGVIIFEKMNAGQYFSGLGFKFLDFLNAWILDATKAGVNIWSPHNSYISIIGYRGIFSLLIYVFIILFVIYCLINKRKQYYLFVCLISILLSVIVYGFFEDDLIFISTSANTLLLSIMFANEIELPVKKEKQKVEELKHV